MNEESRLKLQTQVVAVLQAATAPLTTGEIVAAIGGVDANDVSHRLGNLVRDKRVERHHSPAGLRYSLTASRRGDREGKARRSMAEAVVAELERRQPQTIDQLAVALRLREDYPVKAALQYLRSLSKVERKHYSGQSWYWIAGSDAGAVLVPAPKRKPATPRVSAAPIAAPPEDDDELPPCIGERMHEILLDRSIEFVENHELPPAPSSAAPEVAPTGLAPVATLSVGTGRAPAAGPVTAGPVPADSPSCALSIPADLRVLAAAVDRSADSIERAGLDDTALHLADAAGDLAVLLHDFFSARGDR